MYKNRKFLCIITARSGSKGIKNKNIQIINKKPLIYYSINSAKNSKYLDKIIFSTDSLKYKKKAIQYGIDVPFIRPKKLSKDTTPSADVIIHAINFLKENNIVFDYVVLLEPTSPFTTSKDIDLSIKKIVDKKSNSLLSITEATKFNINFQFKKFKSKIKALKKNNNHTRRQDVDKTFVIDGGIYISKINHFMKNKSFVSNDTVGIEFEKWKSLEIDDIDDLNFARLTYKSKKNEIKKNY